MNEEQALELMNDGPEAVSLIADLVLRESRSLVLLAKSRASGPEGQAYGDSSYGKTVGELMVDVCEEIADAIFYMHLILRAVRLEDEADVLYAQKTAQA